MLKQLPKRVCVFRYYVLGPSVPPYKHLSTPPRGSEPRRTVLLDTREPVYSEVDPSLPPHHFLGPPRGCEQYVGIFVRNGIREIFVSTSKPVRATETVILYIWAV
jgi:hypothetical protein